MNKSHRANKHIPLSISLVIPTYNNAATLSKYLSQCITIMKNYCKDYEILVSNDASTDNTKEILSKFIAEKHLKIFHQKANLGISDNIRFLYSHTKKQYTLLFSIDGGWDTQDLIRLAKAAYDKKADIVIGKRQKKQYTLYRHIISFFYNSLPYVFFGIKTHDPGSIKIFRSEIFQTIPLYSKSVFFEAEMLMKALKHGYQLEYIHINHKVTTKTTKSSINKNLVQSALKDLLLLRLRGL